VEGCFVKSAVPFAGYNTIWITGAGDDISAVFFALGGVAGAGCVGDYVEAEGFGYSSSWDVLVMCERKGEERRGKREGTLSSNSSVS